jgi:hypothetical protein
LPDLLRRVAVLTVMSAAGIALFAPVTARSAVPSAGRAAAPLLYALASSPVDLARGSLADRAATSRLATAVEVLPAAAEILVPTDPSARADAPMQATLLPVAEPALPSVAEMMLAAPIAVPASVASGDTVTGLATWYCCSLGYRGQAVVALSGALGGQYVEPPAARVVTVCGDRCVSLPVVDYCECLWGTASQRVADLSPEAWAAVTDSEPTVGLVTVTVYLGG